MNEPGNKTGNFRKCGDVLFHHIKKAYLYIATFLHLEKKDLIATHPNGYGLTLRKLKSTSKIDFQKHLMILAPFFPAAPDPQKRENTARLGGRRQAHAPG